MNSQPLAQIPIEISPCAEYPRLDCAFRDTKDFCGFSSGHLRNLVQLDHPPEYRIQTADCVIQDSVPFRVLAALLGRGAVARDGHQGVVKYLRLLFTPSSFPPASIESTV